MELSEMTKEQLIELVQQLQFSLKETHIVIQRLAKDIPLTRRMQEQEARDSLPSDKKLSLKEQLNKHDLFRIYDYIVAADVFNGVENSVAKENAINTIFEMLEIEGIPVKKESLYSYFPVAEKTA